METSIEIPILSAYYINANENPSLELVGQPLTENNDNSWSKAMRLALISKKKFAFDDL